MARTVLIAALASTASALNNFGPPKISVPSLPSLPSAPSLPSVPTLPAALSEAGPAKLAGGAVATIALAAAALSLTGGPVEKGSMDQYLAVGVPGGTEKLIVGKPFVEENGNLGMWTWVKTSKYVAPVAKELTPERQVVLKDQYVREMKVADVEAQSQGFESAKARGLKKYDENMAEIARVKAEKAAAKAAAKAAKEAEATAAKKAI